jgi:hypothetical protein
MDGQAPYLPPGTTPAGGTTARREKTRPRPKHASNTSRPVRLNVLLARQRERRRGHVIPVQPIPIQPHAHRPYRGGRCRRPMSHPTDPAPLVGIRPQLSSGTPPTR